MIHTLDTLNIRTYGEIDRTENISLFKKWYNILPVRFFNIQNIITEIARGLNTGIDKSIMNELARISLINKIMILQALHDGIYNLIVLKPFNDSFKITKKRKTNLLHYIELVTNITGIVIKDIDGLNKLQKETHRLSDKLSERFSTQAKKGDDIPFTQYTYGVFAVMEMSYNPNMKMSEFIDLIVIANKKIIQLEKQRNKNG